MMDLFALTSRPPLLSPSTSLLFPLTRNSFECTWPLRSRAQSVSVSSESPGNSSLSPAPSSSSSSSSSSQGEDLQAVDGVPMGSALEGKSIAQLSNIIGDECHCVCSFLPFFRTFHRKEQLVAFFSFLRRTFGSNIELTVRPTLHEGVSISVAWKLGMCVFTLARSLLPNAVLMPQDLPSSFAHETHWIEWNKKHIPLGRGIILHLCQIYQGHITIRNAEMFLEPFLQFEPFKTSVEAVVKVVAEKIRSLLVSKKEDKKRAAFGVLTLLVAAAATATILMLLVKEINKE